MSESLKSFTLNYTDNEWDMLEHVASERGARNFRRHVIASIYDMVDEIKYLELAMPSRKRIRYDIPDDIYPDVINACQTLQIVPTKFITRFIVDPMLRDYLDWEGSNSGIRLLKR